MRPRTFAAVFAALVLSLVVVSVLVGSGPVASAFQRMLGFVGATDPAGRPGHGAITRIDVFLRLFVALRSECQARGSKLSIVRPSRCVVRLLALTGLDAVLDVQPESWAR